MVQQLCMQVEVNSKIRQRGITLNTQQYLSHPQWHSRYHTCMLPVKHAVQVINGCLCSVIYSLHFTSFANSVQSHIHQNRRFSHFYIYFVMYILFVCEVKLPYHWFWSLLLRLLSATQSQVPHNTQLKVSETCKPNKTHLLSSLCVPGYCLIGIKIVIQWRKETISWVIH